MVAGSRIRIPGG